MSATTTGPDQGPHAPDDGQKRRVTDNLFTLFVSAVTDWPHIGGDYTLYELYTDIKDGKWSDKIKPVRDLAPYKDEKSPTDENGKTPPSPRAKKYSLLKSTTLPYAVASGTWDLNHRHADGYSHDKDVICETNGPIVPSGIRLLDLDGLSAGEQTAIKVSLDAGIVPWVAACWKSPGGDGLHAFAALDPPPTTNAESHAAFAALIDDLGNKLPYATVVSDPSSKNLMRTSFVSEDSDARIYDNASPLRWKDFENSGADEESKPTDKSTGKRNKSTGKRNKPAKDAPPELVQEALDCMVAGRAGEDDNHLLAVLGNMKCYGFNFKQFDDWAADAGCTCNREPRWNSAPQGTQSDQPGWALVNTARARYGMPKNERPSRRQDDDQDHNKQNDEHDDREHDDGENNTTQPEDTDLLCEHYADRILKVNHNIAIKKPNGLWVRYAKEPHFIGLVTKFVDEARKAHRKKQTAKRISVSTANNVIAQLHGEAEYGTFEQVDLTSHFDTAPLIPFTDGTHIHLDQGQDEICTCPLDGLDMIDHGWVVMPPDFSLLQEPKPDIMHYFGDDIFRNVGRRLAGPNKGIDLLISSASNTGKSSLGLALQFALPGVIRFLDSSTLSKDTSTYSAHVIHLTESRITIFDEVSRADFDWTKIMFEITADIPEVNPKHLQPERRRLIGTAMLIAPATPEINSAEQGIENRIGAVFKPPLADNGIDSERRTLWTDKKERAKLRAWLIHYAVEEYPYRNENSRYGDQHARTSVIDQATPEQVALARQELDDLYPESGYLLEDIKARLVKAGIENLPIDDKGYGQFLRQCYPPAESVRRRWAKGEDVHRRWIGIGYREPA